MSRRESGVQTGCSPLHEEGHPQPAIECTVNPLRANPAAYSTVLID